MKISIFGLGYVGCVTAACLAQDGNTVIGVDVNPHKVAVILNGESPLVEPGLAELIKKGVLEDKLLSATQNPIEAVHGSDVSLVCVGTPSNENGSLDLQYVTRVCEEIGAALKTKRQYHVVVIRSTVLPGTVEEKLVPILERTSGLKSGNDFGVCMNPEFLREGSAIKDYYHPGFVVIGELDAHSGEALEKIYAPVQAPLFRTHLKNAEMVKYVCNTYHALKIVFANEVGSICKSLGIDGQEVMEIFVHDTQLNISPAYLRPGFAFGGSCLPKDVRALTYRAKELDADCAVLNAIMPSNKSHVEAGIRMVERTMKKKVGILGLSFKANTDDLRESPAIVLAERLIGRGYQVHIYDEQVMLSQLIGANKAFLEKELPHITSIICSTLEELTAISEVIVVTHGDKNFKRITELLTPGHTLIDLVGTFKHPDDAPYQYEGIAW